MGFATTILHSQFFVRPPVPSSDFSDQTVVVTGTTSGLIYEAAKHVLRLGASKLILAVRNVQKGEQVELDLSKFASVKKFGGRIKTLDRLDAVIQNAGIMTSKFTSVEGCESQVAVNVIGPALLGYLVIPKLQESAAETGSRGRLAFVGSDLQFLAPLKEKSRPRSLLTALNSEEHVDMSNRWIACVIRRFIIGIVARSTEVGSRTLVFGVKPELGEECHGAFLMDCKVCGDLTSNTKSSEMKEAKTKFLGELRPRLQEIYPEVPLKFPEGNCGSHIWEKSGYIWGC
ncbi:hypothetical protein COCVIDRAFT_41940 [Bipolaris victoriae FI3]|uniref:Ketoreductase (KR) domain-containing protein n=1 Tax=Bipolaris victoriae (strain FI3) TaxID=930091 RepID=W7DVR2_BIPV3|nr:hypothetical protein COCVIDRAFT_41940 [Bipolaris victoriae FI3]